MRRCWGRRGELTKGSSGNFGPEGPVIPAQAEGLGPWCPGEGGPERAINLVYHHDERPFQGRGNNSARLPRPSAWAGIIGLSGRKTLQAEHPRKIAQTMPTLHSPSPPPAAAPRSPAPPV